MELTGRIARIHHKTLRCVLWFFVFVADALLPWIIEAALAGALFSGNTWRIAWVMYGVGVRGIR